MVDEKIKADEQVEEKAGEEQEAPPLRDGEFRAEYLGGLCFTVKPFPKPFLYRHYGMWKRARMEAKRAGALLDESMDWIAALVLIQDWKCDYLPDPRVLEDLEALQNGEGNELPVIIHVGRVVREYVVDKAVIPKN
jgi:hypothetical protein